MLGSATVSVASVGVPPAEFLRSACSPFGEHARNVANDPPFPLDNRGLYTNLLPVTIRHAIRQTGPEGGAAKTGFPLFFLTAKQRKEHRVKNLWCFFFAIFAFFVVNSAWVAVSRIAPQSPNIMHSREDFTTDGTDGANAECKMQNEDFLSVKSVKSAVQFLWLRLVALRVLSLFAANQFKCLSMNHLHPKTEFFRPSPIKPNQA